VKSGSTTDPSTGSSHIPTTEILTKVRTQFTGLENELKEQQATNQGILDQHTDYVKQCNRDRAARFSGNDGVIALKKAMEAARKTHNTCRVDEDTAIGKMETDCNTFQGMPRCGAGTAEDAGDQNWFSTKEMKTNRAYKSTTLQEVIDQATLCRAGVNDVSTRAQTCDANQCTFQSAFTAYEDKLWDTCMKLDTCYEQAVHNKNYAEGKIKVLEEEQKTMWRMVQRVHCYLDLLEGGVFNQAKIDECNDLKASDFENRRAEKGETTGTDANLNLNPGDTEAKNDCEEHGDNEPEDGGAVDDANYPLIQDDYATTANEGSRYRPGDADWEDGEYDKEGLTAHGKINEPVLDACSALLLQATA